MQVFLKEKKVLVRLHTSTVQESSLFALTSFLITISSSDKFLTAKLHHTDVKAMLFLPFTWPSGLRNFICIPRKCRFLFTYFRNVSAVRRARVHACTHKAGHSLPYTRNIWVMHLKRVKEKGHEMITKSGCLQQTHTGKTDSNISRATISQIFNPVLCKIKEVFDFLNLLFFSLKKRSLHHLANFPLKPFSSHETKQ